MKSVSPLSAGTRWEPSNNYDVIITIDSFPKEYKLKPGMTAEVEIVVGRYKDVIAVPVQAVTTHSNKEYVFVQDASGEFVSTPIKTGNSNASFVAIKEGLEAESVVALDAYQRGLIEFDSKEKQVPEVPTNDVSQAEAPGVDDPKVEVPEEEAPKVEAPKVEAEVKVEASQVEATFARLKRSAIAS